MEDLLNNEFTKNWSVPVVDFFKGINLWDGNNNNRSYEYN